MLVDTHAHLFWEDYKQDFDEVVSRCVDSGVTTIVNVGVDVPLSKVATEMESDKVTFYSAIAIHPEEAVEYAQIKDLRLKIEEDIQALEQIYLENPEKVIAIGECGLDYTHPKKAQKELFQAQIDLAKKLNLLLFIHVRDDRSKDPNNTECWDEVIEMSKEHFGIYHCYSGLPKTTRYILDATRFLISFAGNITYPKNDYLREAVRVTPLDRIVLETDCPFLSPQSKRGKRNEPSSVKEIAEFIAEIKGISFEEVANQTTNNFLKLTSKN